MNPRRSPVEKAKAAWGSDLPPEVLALAEACASSTNRAVAKRIGYSDAVVSHVLARSYHKGDMSKVLAKVRGVFMGEVVLCPIYDLISRDRCIDVQNQPFASTNPARVRAFYECRNCEFRQKKKDVA